LRYSHTTNESSRHTYTWLDNQKNPIKIPAIQYITLVQKWINGKIIDAKLFPTDKEVTPAADYLSGANGQNASMSGVPVNNAAARDWVGKSSGFPETFENDVMSIYRQMMRCYAHLYHGHWIDPYWHLNMTRELNTCFVHFVNVGRVFNIIGDKEMQPMMKLIQIWEAKGLLPNSQQQQKASSSRMETPLGGTPA